MRRSVSTEKAVEYRSQCLFGDQNRQNERSAAMWSRCALEKCIFSLFFKCKNEKSLSIEHQDGALQSVLLRFEQNAAVILPSAWPSSAVPGRFRCHFDGEPCAADRNRDLHDFQNALEMRYAKRCVEIVCAASVPRICIQSAAARFRGPIGLCTCSGSNTVPGFSKFRASPVQGQIPHFSLR